MTAPHFQLESLPYQTDAVDAVVRVFDGTPKTLAHEQAGNRCPLSWEQLKDNIQKLAHRHRISDERLHLTEPLQGQPILIEGARLAALMIEHNLGVSTAQTFALKRLDTDFFEED